MQSRIRGLGSERPDENAGDLDAAYLRRMLGLEELGQAEAEHRQRDEQQVRRRKQGRDTAVVFMFRSSCQMVGEETRAEITRPKA